MTRHSASLAAPPSYDLSDDQFARIARFIKARAGITLTDGGRQLVISRLSRHLDRLQLSDFATYLDHVTSHAGRDEAREMIDRLTTNTTRFFREPEHFDILERQAMPALIRKARAGGRVRLWSAACSSGEEPYSIAATVLAAFPDAPRHDIKILATDISTAMLKKGRDGVYERRLVADLSADRRRALFGGTEQGETLTILPELRGLVTFRYLNFVEPWPVSGPFDVIFCRNAAIYMDADTQAKLWAGLDRVLDDDGLLFIGHSERIGPELAGRLSLFATTSFRRHRTAKAPGTEDL